MIQLKNVNKFYGKGRENQVHAVNNITMTLPDTGMVAIFGKSGCGKTTLLNMIGGLDDLSSGEVLLDGKKITPDADETRNLNVGYIFQNYNLSNQLTVFENVAASLRLCGINDANLIEERVIAALKCVDMDKFRNRMPNALSGGQQQRVAVARAIVKNPSLILADEPTGNLDEQNTVMVMDLLKSISKERLVLLVTHEAHLVDSYCDKVVGISDGEVFEERENTVTEGYKGKKTNEVYLGDMNREEFSDGEISIEYFGDSDKKPKKLRIISASGNIYLSAESGVKLKLIDSSSELVVHEGKHSEISVTEKKEFPEELKKPLPLGKTGRMYDLKGAIKSGFKANFSKQRKRRKILIVGMALFSAIIVYVTASFGCAIYNYLSVEENYNSNAVAVDTSAITEEEARKIVSDGEAELYTLSYFSTRKPNVHETLYFSFGNFETAAYNYGGNNLNYAYAHPLPAKLLQSRSVIAGKGTVEEANQVVITKALADVIIKKAKVSNITQYEDLLYCNVSEENNAYIENFGGGFSTGYGTDDMKNIIVGVVDGDNSEIFYDDYVYLKRAVNELYGFYSISDEAHSGIKLKQPLNNGEIAVLKGKGTENRGEVIGEKVFKVVETFNAEVSDAELSEYTQNGYGLDVTDGIESYLLLQFGVGNVDDWLNMYSDKYGKGDRDEALRQVTKEYEAFMESVKADCAREKYGLPEIIMTREDMESIATAFSSNGTVNKNKQCVFYSYDAKALGEKLSAEYGYENVITPQEAREYLRKDFSSEFATLGATLVIVSAILAVCMYFIMRSALMGDIREIGINRAIGVSKKNLCFRYFIETLVMFTLTVFVGFLFMSFIVSSLSNASLGNSMLVYYPWWLALITLVGIFAVTIVCGQLPIRSLLRKSPAEILTKYDI